MNRYYFSKLRILNDRNAPPHERVNLGQLDAEYQVATMIAQDIRESDSHRARCEAQAESAYNTVLMLSKKYGVELDLTPTKHKYL